MPLDVGQPTHLADLASWLGITPIPNEALEAHKQAEVAKRTPTWMYRHHALMSRVLPLSFLTLVVACGTSLVLAIMARHNYPVALAYLAASGGLASICAAMTNMRAFSATGMRVYGPAEWREFECPADAFSFFGIPVQVEHIARKLLQHSMDDMTVVYGKLFQDYRVVDPYLLIRRGDQQIVIGIWDDEQIIRLAVEH